MTADGAGVAVVSASRCCMSRASQENGTVEPELDRIVVEPGIKQELVALRPQRTAQQEVAKERRALSDEARAEGLSVDMEESLQAANSAELALTHQMAAAHALALRFIGRANLCVESLGNKGWDMQREYVAEMCRLSNAAARLMTTYQEAMLVLARVRTAGKQIHVAQHVSVTDGGQAVITGQVGDRGRASSEKS